MRGWRNYIARSLSWGWKVGRRIAHAQSGFRVLMYHAIGTPIPEDKLGLYTISPLSFSNQMRMLAGEEFAPVLDFVSAIDGKEGIAITFDDGYRDVLTDAAPLLARLGLPFTVFANSGYVQSGNSLYLSPQELRELSEYPGATIGSHAASHVKLTDCSNEQLHDELAGSRNYLEDLLQRPVTTISYPHGAVDARVWRAAQDVGYLLGASSQFGTNLDRHNPLLLKRTDIWSTDDISNFRSKVAGNWDWMQWRT